MDVSNLWNGCLYRTGIGKKFGHVPIFLRGCFYMTGIFGVETGKWKCAQVFQNLSLGLQQFTNSI